MMKEKKAIGIVENPAAFSLATLLYTRLRRVKGRVIDVVYFIENKQYARNILEIASQTEDADLLNYVERLTDLLELNEEEIIIPVLEEIVEDVQPTYIDDEITEEDIYRAQVSHHYIGALR